MSSRVLLLALFLGICVLQAQTDRAGSSNSQKPAQSPIQGNLFEAVPALRESPQPKASGPIIEAIEFRGARRIPESSLRAMIESRAGGVYDLDALRRDAHALYATRRFSAVDWQTDAGSKGAVVRFVVTERPLIQAIGFTGDDSVTVPEIVERLKERKVDLRVETLFNENELGRAAVTIHELLIEKGLHDIRVTPLVDPVAPQSAVRITFQVEESQ